MSDVGNECPECDGRLRKGRCSACGWTSQRTPAKAEDQYCRWLNQSGFRCLRFADIGNPKAWYCGFHYWVKQGRFRSTFHGLVEFVQSGDSSLYCGVETHHSVEYLWALANGETVPQEVPHPCDNCREAYVDGVGQWRGIVDPPAWAGRYVPSPSEHAEIQQKLGRIGTSNETNR